jgi:AcrR family transcriptional regulator
MDTRTALVSAALEVIEHDGEAGFSTRAVCGKVGVGAPTLYHHFGSADGLLSAALAEAFGQFLAAKQSEAYSSDPLVALRQGWDNYVHFAAERPRLYAAMLVRVLQGITIPAADAARALLLERIESVAAAHRLTMSVPAAADLVWASAHAAATLYLPSIGSPPDPVVVANLRDDAINRIHTPLEDNT